METIKLQFELNADRVAKWTAENVSTALLSSEEISKYCDKPLVITEEFLKGIKASQEILRHITEAMSSIAVARIVFLQDHRIDERV